MNRTGYLAVAAVMLSLGCGSETPSPDGSQAVDSAFSIGSSLIAPSAVNDYVARQLGFTSRGGTMRCAYVPLGQDGDRIFINSACSELVADGDSLVEGSGRGGPVALRLKVESDSAVIVGHEVPQDGGGYSASVRRIFPSEIADRVFAGATPDTLRKHLRAHARSTGPPR